MSESEKVEGGVAEGTVTVASEVAETRPNVGLEEFLEIVEDCNSAKEVAERTGMKPASVLARMSNLRTKDGIDVKRFKRGGGPRRDVAKAKEFLAALRAKKAEAAKS